MNIANALTIEGWMEPQELLWLARQAESHLCIVEIGSYKGRSTRALADNTPGLVVAIDDFSGPREIEITNRDLIFNQFLENMVGTDGHLQVIRADHRHLPALDFSPDMVFIDGAHEYEAVKADIELWKRWLKPGGLLCGHDYWQGFEGLKQAVHELIPDFKVASNTTIWYTTV